MRALIVLLIASMGLVLNSYARGNSEWAAHPALLAQVAGEGSYLGIGLADIDADRANALKLKEERGVEVIKVEENSPAAKAGLLPGDVLLTYNGENIVGAQQLGRLVRETPPGRKVKIQVWRDGKSQNITVVTGAWQLHDGEMPGDFSRFEGAILPPGGADVPAPLLIWRSAALGIECERVDSQLAQYFGVAQGALVRSVFEGSIADSVGLKAGDVLTEISGKPVISPRDVSPLVRLGNQTGKPVLIVVVRNRKEMRLKVK